MSDSSARPSTVRSHDSEAHDSEDSEDSYHSSDYDAYDDDELETSDSEEAGFLTAPRVYHGFAPARRPFAPPVRVRALEESKTIRDPFPRRRPDQDEDDDPTTSLPRQKGESDLAFKIRKSQWKDVRGLLGPRAMAAGAAGVRLVADAENADTTGKGKGKASAKGGSKQTGASQSLKNTPDFIDLTNAIALRAPADVLLALLAVAPRDALEQKVKGDAVLNFYWGGSTLLHFAMFPAHAATKDPKARAAPVSVSVVKRICELVPDAICAVSRCGYTPMYALARFGVANALADRLMAQTVDALVACSKAAGEGENAEALARAKGGAAVLVAKPAREASRPVPDYRRPILEQANRPRSHARAYPLHAACARHHGQTVRALLRAVPEAAAFRAQMGFEKRTPVARNSVDETRVVEGRPAARRSGGAAPAADADAAVDDTSANPPSRDPRLDTSSHTYIDQSPGFPLHMLLRVSENGDPPDLAAFKAVLDAYPDAAKQPAGGGARRRQPAHVLHALCSQPESPVRLVKCLLKAVPESARIIERGETALHCALDSDALHPAHQNPRTPAPSPAAVDVALAVLRAHPGACGVADARGTYPAFLAVKNKWPPAVCVEILRAFPDAGLKKGPRDGMFPLHQATRDGNVETVRAVAEAFPRLARAVSEDDGLPLHVAARHSAPDAVTRALLESFPAGARRQDAEGELPLHAVCAALGSDDLMVETSEADAENDRRDYENAKLLYAAFPEGAFHTDASGKIPAERLPMYDIHRMLSRDVFGGDAWRGEGWRVMGGAGDGASQSHSANTANTASGAALLVRVAANELAVAAMSAPEIERLTVALDRARAAVAKETLRRPFEEALLAEHDRDEKWMCPIGYGLFRDPVRAGDGHVYERSNIVKWQEKSGAVVARPFLGAPNKRAWKSPMTGLSCHDFALAPAAEIRSQIDEKLDEMMRAERAKPSGNENGEGAEDGGDDAHPARGSKAKGKAKAAPRAPRGAAAGTGPPRGAKRAAEGAAAPAARATRAKR